MYFYIIHPQKKTIGEVSKSRGTSHASEEVLNKIIVNNILLWKLHFICRAQDMIKDHFGSVAAAAISNLDIERLPVLALVYKLRGTLEIFQVSLHIVFLKDGGVFLGSKFFRDFFCSFTSFSLFW